MSSIPRFHLAFSVNDLTVARSFYEGVLGCGVGRSDTHWIDFDLHGHQIVAHLDETKSIPEVSNSVDGDDVPVPHFGLILSWRDWEVLAEKLQAAGLAFVIAPHIRFKGLPGEQATMFFRDPSGNALEFKAFRSDAQIFATE
ncbi:VOC family protein [Parvibaculaceae bacterium PLY_AMNH_Bact1]|nr:VOC family protein [Parvibaculaceae bacterium PLY_AMNH_Bact1]